MGLFNIFYPNRPGKGVEKDEPPKHAFFQFWTLVWRKLSRLVLLNMMYFLAVSPLLFLLFLFLNDFFGFAPLDPERAVAIEAFAEELMYIPILGGYVYAFFLFLLESVPFLFFALVLLSALLYGPLTCGFTYILRNFARQEHAWISDFWTRAKMNFIPGLKMGALELVFLILLYSSFTATGAEGLEGSMRIMMLICRYSMFGVGMIYLFMRHYLYVMLVTFDLKIREVIRNAFIFAVLGLPRNLLALLGQIAVIVAVIFLIPVMYGLVELLLTALIALSFMGFIGVFTTYPVIRKFLLDPLTKKKEAEETAE
ncbi:MAG: hypothetical protein FWG93_04485 [Oscillospiraceae bacterium]|nr:hypothetical protein [Oscillospiraceae bacterium]